MPAVRERGNWKLRAADRYVGIPLVFLAGLLRRKTASPPQRPRRVGLLITTAIGDSILNTAAIISLRKSYPESRLTAFVSAGNLGIVRMMKEIDEVVPVPMTNPARAAAAIRGAGAFDVWIDFGPWPRINALLTALSRSAFTIGFRSPGQFRHYAYDAAVPHSLRVHEVENYRTLLGPLAIDGKALPGISVAADPPRPRAAVVHLFPGGSRHYLKSWPEENWLALFRMLSGRGYEIFLTGSPADKPRLEAVVAKAGGSCRITVVAGACSLEETARLIRSSALTISVDTGILHLASAVGADLVALHGPTSPRRWGALNANSISLESGLPCSPCVSIGYEKGCGVNRCMQAITPDRVMEAVSEMERRRESRAGVSAGPAGGLA